MNGPRQMLVRVDELKPGDRFSFHPPAWAGPGTVTESRAFGDRYWFLQFDAAVPNPPGVFHGERDVMVSKFKPKRPVKLPAAWTVSAQRRLTGS